MGAGLGFGTDVVGGLGQRLVAIDRPGLGGSDPDPGRTMADWPDDVRGLAGDRGLGTPPAVGFSQGAPFALALAAAGVASSVALVAGQDDLAHPPTTALLDPAVAGLVRAIADDPEGVETEFAASGGAELLWDLAVRTASPADNAVFTAPTFAAAYRAALDEGFAQGGAGYARDLVLAMGRWPFRVEDVAVPVHLWYGTLDASPVHSPDRGELLAARLPNAERHLVADAGSAILWTLAGPILTELTEGAPP
jgi:pimeloyl-ACP methyl ester carboxylesterase